MTIDYRLSVPQAVQSLVVAEYSLRHLERLIEADSSIALVLAVDPQRIVHTSPKDIQTPIFSNNPQMSDDFYVFSEKFKIITAYIDHIYLISQIENGINAQERYRFLEVEKAHIQSLIVDEEEDGERQALQDRLVEIKAEILELQRIFGEESFTESLPVFQLKHLIRHYQSVENSPEEFKKLFGRMPEGRSILDELNHCLEIVQQLETDDKYSLWGMTGMEQQYKYRTHFNRLLGPSDLASLTHRRGNEPFDYNEVNVRSDHMSGARNITVAAVLIDKRTIHSAVEGGKQEQLAKVFQYANANNITILVR